MAHRQLIGHHQHIAGLFGRVYAPIMVSSQQFLRREPRFINAVDESHLVTQPDRGNEWPGTPRPACGVEYPLLATAKSPSETVFQIGLRMHRRRSEDRRVGKRGVSRCRLRWSQYNKKTKRHIT